MSGKLGHFELLEQIGKGGMAAVYRAYDPSLNRTVAIKLLDEELARQDPQFVESFIHEAQTAAAINHPNIVQIYFVGEEKGNYYIAMELLQGRSLDEIIKEDGPQPEETVLTIGVQIAGALNAAYANQMVHGDIKPQNIFITNYGVAKLLDFGLAKMANIESSTESDGSVWGSAYYISPERVGHKAEDFRSDIYSLGATLFHAMVGHPPFDADSPEELAIKRLSEKAPTLRRINPDITANTERIIARMLNKSIFLRYLDYNSLIQDLEAAQSGTSDQPVQESTDATNLVATQTPQTANAPQLRAGRISGRVPMKGPNKNKLAMMIACGVVVLLAAGGIVMFAVHKNSGTAPGVQSISPSGTATVANPSTVSTGESNGLFHINPVASPGTSEMALEAVGSGTSAGTPVSIGVPSEEAANQKWNLVPKGDNLFVIKPSYSNTLALAVAGGGTKDGTPVILETESGEPWQLWSLKQNSDGTLSFTPKHAPDMGLNDPGGNKHAGTKQDLWHYHPTNEHLHWVLKPLAGAKIPVTGLSATSPAREPLLDAQTVVMQDDFHYKTDNIKGLSPTKGTETWKLWFDKAAFVVDGTQASFIINNDKPDVQGHVKAFYPIDLAGDTLYTLKVAFKFKPTGQVGQKRGSWAGFGFGNDKNGNPDNEPWFLIPAQREASNNTVAQGHVGHKKAGDTIVSAVNYASPITAKITWNTSTGEAQFYINDQILPGWTQNGQPSGGQYCVFLEAMGSGEVAKVTNITLTAQSLKK